MITIEAIYENGVFRPISKVDLPDQSQVILHTEVLRNRSNMDRSVPGEIDDEGLKEIYEVLSRRFASGETDVAARHNEHQP